MENLFTHNVTEARVIRIFFRILFAFLILVIVCAISLNINDSVTFKEGEIIAEIPQQDYRAPFESIPIQVSVRDGQQVKAGDTLVILLSEQLRKDYQNALATYASLIEVDSAIQQLIRSTSHKIENLKQEREIN